jgi:hypothetical protein
MCRIESFASQRTAPRARVMSFKSDRTAERVSCGRVARRRFLNSGAGVGRTGAVEALICMIAASPFP